MENNKSRKSGANSTLYNVEMKGFPLLLRIFIWNYPSCFTVTKCPSATSIYLSVSANEPGIKSEIYGFMWQVAPDSKIQCVSFEMSTEFLLEISALVDKGAIDVYIFCDSLLSLLFPTTYLFSPICMHEI